MWNYARTQLEVIAKNRSNIERKIGGAISELYLHQSLVQADLDHLAEADGYATWRQKESRDLSRLVQARLEHLQNPDNCTAARKLVCGVHRGCGYGCEVHCAVYWLQMAYGTGRTLVLESTGWRYNRRGLSGLFLPLSETCTTTIDCRRRCRKNPGGKAPAIPADLADR